MEKQAKEICDKYDLKFIELEILTILMDGRSGDTASQIGQSNHISKAHLSKSLDHLRKKGFIRFDKDSFDHRLTHIVLSDQAKMAAGEMNEMKDHLETRLFSGFTDTDKVMTKRLIEQLSENLATL